MRQHALMSARYIRNPLITSPSASTKVFPCSVVMFAAILGCKIHSSELLYIMVIRNGQLSYITNDMQQVPSFP